MRYDEQQLRDEDPQGWRILHDLDQLSPPPINGNTPPPPRRPKLTPSARMRPERVNWLWAENGGRIPQGALSIFAGREGTGKSSFAVWLTALITTGRLPGELYGQPRSVLYISIEESWPQALVPKLIASGADLERVYKLDVLLEDDEETVLDLPIDNTLLEDAINHVQAGAVVIDPLMSVIGYKLDTHRARDVRRALDPLAKIADRTGAAILGVAHFNKSSGTDAAQLITGSGAFKDVARAVFGFAAEPGGSERVISQVKNSLGPCDLSLCYQLDPVTIEAINGLAETVRLQVTGISARHVSDLLGEARSDEEDRAERDEAADWLRGFLEAHGGSEERPVILKAARSQGFSESTLKRARKAAGVIAERRGFNELGSSGSIWLLPDTIPRSGQETPVQSVQSTVLGPEPSDPNASGSIGPRTQNLEPNEPNGTERGSVTRTCRVCRQPLAEAFVAEGFDTHPACSELVEVEADRPAEC